MRREDDILGEMGQMLRPDFLAGANSDEAVARAESELSVTFPRSYRLFLLSYGAGAVGAYELSGLVPGQADSDEPPMWSDVVRRTRQVRRASGGQIPESFIPFSDDGSDYTFFIDTAERNAHDESPVKVLGPGMDGVTVAESFLAFLRLAATGRVLDG